MVAGLGVVFSCLMFRNVISASTENILKVAEALNVPPFQNGGSELWNELTDLDRLQKESKCFDLFFSLYDQEAVETIHDFLSLNPEGQKQASEYIDFLMQKQEKK